LHPAILDWQLYRFKALPLVSARSEVIPSRCHVRPLSLNTSVPADSGPFSGAPGKAGVAVLLCSYFGQDFLPEQLDSIALQTHPFWRVWASDDGSADKTLGMLREYQEAWGRERLDVRQGPQKGFVANFLSLVCDESIQAEYFAYSDQDDVWDADKLERAIDWLKTVPGNIPALFCSRTRLVKDGRVIGRSPLFRRPPSFANALVQNVAGGNTMVFNDAARRLLAIAGADVNVITHDWWTYLVVTASGGRVFFDAEPTVSYRQHDANKIGAGISWSFLEARFYGFFAGRLRAWINCNIVALERLRTQFSPESERIFARFVRAREQGFLSRLAGLRCSGVYRQSAAGNIALVAAAAFKKI
jgi:glycosyltransferase involved in cell wall biosynthesis